MNKLFAGLLLVGGVGAALPDPESWRVYNPAVTQATIDQTICVRGWTRTVRPPYYITQVIKKRLLEAQGMTWADAFKYQLDHRIPLDLGGEPGDLDHTSNFQLQPWPVAERKDRLERVSSACVCAGKVTLDQARRDLAGDWQQAYHRYAKMVCRRAR